MIVLNITMILIFLNLYISVVFHIRSFLVTTA